MHKKNKFFLTCFISNFILIHLKKYCKQSFTPIKGLFLLQCRCCKIIFFGLLNYKFFAAQYLPTDLYSLSLIHISEPTRRTPISYAVFCLKKKNLSQDTLCY